MCDMEERSMAAAAFQAGIDSFKDSDARLEAENVNLRKEIERLKGERCHRCGSVTGATRGSGIQLHYYCGTCFLNEQARSEHLVEDIRFLLKCIVGDPTDGMGLERDDPARVHFRARLDAIRKKVT